MAGRSWATIFLLKECFKNNEELKIPKIWKTFALSANDKLKITYLVRKYNHWSFEQLATIGHKEDSPPCV